MKECAVQLRWDDEAYVWMASSEDVPGLVLECGSLDALMEQVRYTVSELITIGDDGVMINFNAQRRARAYA